MTLTDEMRAFLNDPTKRRMRTWDFTGAFIKAFNLTASEAAALLRQWSVELTAPKASLDAYAKAVTGIDRRGCDRLNNALRSLP